MMLFRFLICFCIASVVFSNNALSLNYFNYKHKSEIKICLGTVEKNTFLDVDMEVDFGFIITTACLGPFTTDSKLMVNYLGEEYEGEKLKTTLILFDEEGMKKTVDFSICYINNVRLRNEDSLSLTFRFKDYSFSIIHTLFDSKLISSRTFTLSPSGKITNSGIIYFGQVPKNDLDARPHKFVYKVDKDSRSWSFDLQEVHIKIGSKKVNFLPDSKGVFQIKYRNIFAPKKFTDILYEMYFKDKLGTICKVINESSDRYYCDCDIQNSFGEIEFVIDNTLFTFSNSQLFSPSLDSCIFLIETNAGRDDWLIGEAFIKNDLVTFDYDKETITFYSKDKFVSLPKKINTTKIIFIVLIVLLALSTIQIFFTKNKSPSINA